MGQRFFAGLGVIALAVFAIGPTTEAGAEAHGAPTQCQDIVIRNYDGSIYTRTYNLSQKNTGCGLTRRLAHRYLANDGERPPTLLGFQCAGDANGVSCRDRDRRVTWEYHSPSAEALLLRRAG